MVGPSVAPAARSVDFGVQGGDPSRGVDMDLSTCVNRYGPASAAIATPHEIEPGVERRTTTLSAGQPITDQRGGSGVKLI